MRGEALAYPFSTYAVGERRSPHRHPLLDRNYAIPAIAMVATISVVAITFGQSMSTAVPSAPAGHPSAFKPHGGYAASRARTTAPAHDWTVASLQVGASNLSSRVVQDAPVRQRARATPIEIAGMRGSSRVTMAAPLAPPGDDLGGAVLRPHAEQSDDGALALTKCAPRCSALEPPITDAAQLSTDIVPTAGGMATPADALQNRQESVTTELVAPSRQPLLVDSDQGEIIPAGVLASDPVSAGSSIDPAAGEPVYEDDIERANLASSPRDTGALKDQSAQPRAEAFPKTTAAVGDAAPIRGESSIAISAHLTRIKERYPEIPPGQDLVAKSTNKAEAAPNIFVDTSSGGAPVAKKLGSIIIVQDDELVAIKLSELISLFESRLDRPLFVWMTSASAASKFVTTDTLASAGIKARYDSGSSRLVLSVSSE